MRPALALALLVLVLAGAYHFFVIWHQHRMETLGVRGAGPLVVYPALAAGWLVAKAVRGRYQAAACAGLIVLLPTITGLMFTRFVWVSDQTWAWAACVAGTMAAAWLAAEPVR